jgi:hypothetical protein
MKLMDDPLIAMLAAWRTDIDSVPFAHQAEFDRIVRALLGDRGLVVHEDPRIRRSSSANRF